jgi:hypothetical protein
MDITGESMDIAGESMDITGESMDITGIPGSKTKSNVIKRDSRCTFEVVDNLSHPSVWLSALQQA